MYNPSLTEQDINNRERDVNLVFVGNSWLKVDRIAEIKIAFPQIKVYGNNWNWKSLLKSPYSYWRKYGVWDWKICVGGVKALFLNLWKVEHLPMDELVPLYQRCKIGINMHLSFGPSNVRTYQLPANGVMQICDCPEGIGNIFKVGKEVITYHTIEEAIKLIRYYLAHDNERKKIAVAGFKRAMKDYKRLITFSKAIEKIKKGMLEEKIISYKDGTPIKIFSKGDRGED
jgi:spore maturation protein CgeB